MFRKLALIACLVATPALARDLTVVAGGGGFQDNARKHLFQGFAQATGQKVVDDIYDGEQAKIAAMVKNHDVTWDVVMVEAPEMVRGCEDGLFEKMDWSIVDKAKFIPNGTATCGAGAVGWGVTFFYDTKRIANGPTTYAQLWDTNTWPGKRLLRNGAKMTLEIALLADGVPAADVYKVLATPTGQDRAFAKLDAIKPNLVWWKSGAQPLQLVGSGDVAFAVGYVGRTAKAAQDGAAYPLLWQTMLFSFDFWTVVKGSPNATQAMKLVNYMTDAAPLRALAQDWAVSPATTAVAQDPAIRAKNKAMVAEHAADGLFIDTEFWVQYGDDLERRFAAWVAR